MTGSDGVQQTYDGYLVGADRTKDLCVLRINAPKVLLYTLQTHILQHRA